MSMWAIFFIALLVFWCYSFRKQKGWWLHGAITAVTTWLLVRVGVWLLANVLGPILAFALCLALLVGTFWLIKTAVFKSST